MASLYSWFGKWWKRFWGGVGVLFEDYKFARRFMFFWAIWMVTDVYFWFKSIPSVSDNQRLVILAILGIMTWMIGFYQWSREREG